MDGTTFFLLISNGFDRAKEGNLVASPVAALRPSAEWCLRRGLLFEALKSRVIWRFGCGLEADSRQEWKLEGQRQRQKADGGWVVASGVWWQ